MKNLILVLCVLIVSCTEPQVKLRLRVRGVEDSIDFLSGGIFFS